MLGGGDLFEKVMKELNQSLFEGMEQLFEIGGMMVGATGRAITVLPTIHHYFPWMNSDLIKLIKR